MNDRPTWAWDPRKGVYDTSAGKPLYIPPYHGVGIRDFFPRGGELLSTVVPTFSEEAREALTREGFQIFTLHGHSITHWRTGGREFFDPIWHEQRPEIEGLPSRRGQIAILPNELFLPKIKENMSARELLENAKKVKGIFERKIPSSELVEGSAADWVEIIFSHDDIHDSTDKLFWKKGQRNYTVTSTSTIGNNIAAVGRSDNMDVHVINVDPEVPDPSLKIALFFVPQKPPIPMAA